MQSMNLRVHQAISSTLKIYHILCLLKEKPHHPNRPQDDALVISLEIDNHEISDMLMYTDSSVN